MMPKRWGSITALLIILGVISASCGPITGPAPAPEDSAPSARLQLMGETTIDFPDYFQGKVVILSFFAPG